MIEMWNELRLKISSSKLNPNKMCQTFNREQLEHIPSETFECQLVNSLGYNFENSG